MVRRTVDHSITRTSLSPKDGDRIEIAVRSDISEVEALALLDEYRPCAGREGQVSVHKPSAKLGGLMAPFVVDNMDGKGAVFNRDLH